jgi:hypothetical protein
MKRNVIYEKQFEDELAAIEPDSERADDLIRGIEWVLQRDPNHGTRVHSDPPVWFVPACDLYDLPYVLYYTFDAKKIHFLSIRQRDPTFNDPEEETDD